MSFYFAFKKKNNETMSFYLLQRRNDVFSETFKFQKEELVPRFQISNLQGEGGGGGAEEGGGGGVVWISPVGARLLVKEPENILSVIKNNVDIFAWKYSDMAGIDPRTT